MFRSNVLVCGGTGCTSSNSELIIQRLKEEIKASMRLEPGVLTLYATAEKDAPHHVTILEIYADRAAYESHLQTPHFQKYKQGTLEMVQQLELVDVTPLIPGLKIK